MSLPAFILSVLALFSGIAALFWWRHTRIKRRILRDTAHLGPFVDLSLISDKGGMARIYRATNSEIGRECVLKVLRSEMTGNAAIMKKFRNEADILRAIKSAAPDAPVVTVYSTGTIRSTFVEAPYIEMEYIPGIDLADFLQQHPTVEPQITEQVVKRVVQALVAAKGIAIHRDLKPSNILLHHSDPAQAIVCDFGVAKDVDSTTKSQHAFGTASYMAPERCVPEGKVSAASDVYSLGVLWYRMLSGHLLFDDPNPLVVMRAHVERDPTAAIETDIPLQYRAIISRMLSKDPGKRPTLDELWETLVPVPSWGTIPIAKPDTQEEKTLLLDTGKPQGFFRRPIKIKVSFVVEFGVILALAGAGVSFIQTRPAKPPAISPQPDTPHVTLAPPQPVVDSQRKPSSPAMGTIEVTSLPTGAEVTLGDQVLGMTPLQLPIAAGDWPVKIRLARHEPYESSAAIVAAQTTDVHATLSPLSGSMSITSRPAEVGIQIDGNARGRTPLEIASIAPGRYHVTATLEGFPDQRQSVEVLPDQAAALNFHFKEGVGYLVVNSPGVPADIFINGRWVGGTPLDRLPFWVGSHTITARAKGYSEFIKSVEILRDQEVPVIVTLERQISAPPSSTASTAASSGQPPPPEEPAGADTTSGGTLSVNVTIRGRPAWGTVYLNDRLAGTSPQHFPELSPQEYRVRVVRRGFRPNGTTILLGPREIRSVTIDLKSE